MNLVEISEREVIEKARAWAVEAGTRALSETLTDAEVDLYNATSLLVSREASAAAIERAKPCHAKTWPDGGEPFATQSICAKCGGDLNRPVDLSPKGYTPFLICDTCQNRSNSGPGREAVVGDECAIAGCSGHMREQTPEELAASGPDKGLRRFYEDVARTGAISPEHLVFSENPIVKPPRKLSRREQAIEKRRQADPLGRDREDIDYSSIEDPSAR